MRKILFYDCEIVKCVPSRDDSYYGKDPQYQYCDGWHDKAGMGIACIGVYASWKGYNIFLGTQLEEFQKLAVEADEIVGFNSIDFDDKLLQANGVYIQTTFDLLCETRVAAGMPPHYVASVTKRGYALQDMTWANLGRTKSSTGALAPKLWQDGHFKEVFGYCLNDIQLLKELYERRSSLIDPTNKEILFLRGGSRWQWIKAKIDQWLENNKQRWQESYWPIFLWGITHSDISDCRICLTWPIQINGYWRHKEIYIRFKMPKIYVVISARVWNDLRDSQPPPYIPF